PYFTASPVLRGILQSEPASELQTAAIDSLAVFDDPAVATILIANWKSYGPDTRKRALSALLNQRDRVPVLLRALESGQLEPNAIDAAGRARLLQYSDRSIADRAGRLFQGATSDRAKVIDSYRDALKMIGNPDHGKKKFEEACGKCHLPRKQGGRVGPDLSGISSKTNEELLTSILNPSYAIEPQFTNYIVTTKDGRVYDGI